MPMQHALTDSNNGDSCATSGYRTASSVSEGGVQLNYTARLGDELGGLGGLQALYQNRHNHLEPYGINCRRRKNVTRGHQFLKRVPLGSSGFGAHALEKRFDEVVSGPMNGVGIAPY